MKHRKDWMADAVPHEWYTVGHNGGTARTRSSETLTPNDGGQAIGAEDVSAGELSDWRDSSMDLVRGLDVIEGSYDTPVRRGTDSQPGPLPERWQKRRGPR
jgi:hypothetical protein